MNSGWPPVTTETIPWCFDSDEASFIPKSQRRKITPTYEAAIPARLQNLRPTVPPDIAEQLADTRSRLTRLDEQQSRLPFNLPALLLRSESSASSQIENLTSSAKSIALAELSDTAPKNAQIIAGNIDAMRCALSLSGNITPEVISKIHHALLRHAEFAGQMRHEQVWVGGTPYSPHGALFVPPAAKRVATCIDDLCLFVQESDADPIAKAAIAHAQFETIHPFIDGNGRCGRALLHLMLRNDHVLRHATLPLSAGLLHHIDAYMDALAKYQQGDPMPIIVQLANALDLAIAVARKSSHLAESVIGNWNERITERKGSKIRQLPALLTAQPVVDSAYVATHLGITRRAATNLINRACEYDILRPLGNARRGDFYQAPEMIAVLEEISSMPGIRRLLAESGRAV